MYDKTTVEFEYPDYDGDTTDVSVELSEDAEETLFRGLAYQLSKAARNGVFDGRLVHLYKRLSDQRTLHPPWFEQDSQSRIYDVEIDSGDFSILCDVLAHSAENCLGTTAYHKHYELANAVEEIREQLEDGDREVRVDNDTVELSVDKFDCLIHDGDVAKYSNESGETWYKCLVCDCAFAEISDEHEHIHA